MLSELGSVEIEARAAEESKTRWSAVDLAMRLLLYLPRFGFANAQRRLAPVSEAAAFVVGAAAVTEWRLGALGDEVA